MGTCFIYFELLCTLSTIRCNCASKRFKLYTLLYYCRYSHVCRYGGQNTSVSTFPQHQYLIAVVDVTGWWVISMLSVKHIHVIHNFTHLGLCAFIARFYAQKVNTVRVNLTWTGGKNPKYNIVNLTHLLCICVNCSITITRKSLF